MLMQRPSPFVHRCKIYYLCLFHAISLIMQSYYAEYMLNDKSIYKKHKEMALVFNLDGGTLYSSPEQCW